MQNRMFPAREAARSPQDDRWIAKVLAPKKPAKGAPERALEIHGDTHWHVDAIYCVVPQPQARMSPLAFLANALIWGSLIASLFFH